MRTATLNDILAANLARQMADKGYTQASLAKLSGVGQTTISLYLNPGRRQPSKSGKVPSAKFSEVESLAEALEVPAWSLLIPDSAQQRAMEPQAESTAPLTHAEIDDLLGGARPATQTVITKQSARKKQGEQPKAAAGKARKTL